MLFFMKPYIINMSYFEIYQVNFRLKPDNSILNNYKGVDLVLFDEIVERIYFFKTTN